MSREQKTLLSNRYVLDKQLCDKFIQAVGVTIGCNVLITDEKGMVISSSDSSRIGLLHEASLHVINAKRTLYHDRESADKLIGTKPGFTTPLFNEHEVIGTIGVTGTPQEISRYADLLTRMAQAFLESYSQQKSFAQQDYRKQNLLREIITFDKRLRNPDDLYTLGYETGVDLKIPRLAVLIKIRQTAAKTSAEKLRDGDRPWPIISHFFKSSQDIICPQNDTEYVILAYLPDGMQGSSMEKMMQRCKEMEAAFSAANLSVFIGVGSLARNLADLRLSYENACFVVRLLQTGLRTNAVLSIDDLMLEKLAFGLPENICHEAETGVFAPVFKSTQRKEIMELIENWCQQRFHFTHTAEAMHIHKSTLVYRFQRIKELYGLDLYDFDRVIALYLLNINKKLNEELS